MKWLLIIALFEHIGGSVNVIQVKIPMLDEIHCRSALVQTKVSYQRRHKERTKVQLGDIICDQKKPTD